MKTQLLLALTLTSAIASAQTRVTPPENKYEPSEDVKLGREAAAEARRELPVMRDAAVDAYIDNIGRRLVNQIRSDLRHPGFDYSFDVVNVRDINAFALPGGPMFLNRGMIEAAKSEAELAGVMAHEISHVALRHGTAQASAATPYQIGSIAGAILGAVIGGRTGDIFNQAAQFGLGAAFLRYGRDYERQADIEGAQMMARAGYDPRAMANMFRTIEQQRGGGGPEWLSSHPNPGNRHDAIVKEAAMLKVQNPVTNTRGFEQVRTRLRGMPKAPSMEEVTKNAKNGRRTEGATGTTGTVNRDGSVEPPSGRYTEYNHGNLFRVSVPSNWQEIESSNSVTFAPVGAYGEHNGQNVFTHGVEIGIAGDAGDQDLRAATDALVETFARSNPQLRRSGNSSRITVDGRAGLQTRLINRSEVTGDQETIHLVTALLEDGSLVYTIGVAPTDEFRAYAPAFQRVVGSLRFSR
jgi:hypothetical protein